MSEEREITQGRNIVDAASKNLSERESEQVGRRAKAQELAEPMSSEDEWHTMNDAEREAARAAKEKKNPGGPNAEALPQPDGYPQEYQADPSKAYYAQPNGSYMYYPPYPGAVLPDGTPAPFYPPPPPSNTSSPSDGSGGSNLPPPEIARLIPCRYVSYS